jgi:hypothetical protein
LYRIDWTEFGVRDVTIITSGAAIGVASTWLASAMVPVLAPVTAGSLAAAFALVVVGLCGTRVFVRALDRHLRRIGGSP